jgi:hypothetical protein
MAVANFFDKVALGASQLLKNYDQQGFKELLLSQNVLVSYDDDAAEKYEGKVSLDLLIRLLARLYPNLKIQGDGNKEFQQELESLAKKINPQINTEVGEATVCIVVGNTKPTYSIPTFFIGSNSWVCYFSESEPQGSSSSNNPLGAAAAACIGAANLFRHVFSKQLPYSEIDKSFSLSLFNYTYSEDQKGIILPPVNISDTVVVGLGAIGNGLTWLLGQLIDVTGEITFVDHEVVGLSNLQRYILTEQSSIEQAKVIIAEGYLKRTDLTVIKKPFDWRQYVAERQNSVIKTIAVCIDNAEDRIMIQGILPKKIYNAWTQQENLGISRHINFNTDPCLCCLYLPSIVKKSRSQEVADNLNLSHEERLIRGYLANKKLVDEILLNLIADANQLSVMEFHKYLNKPIDIFYSEVVCGGIMMSKTGAISNSKQQIEVPCAFESAMAGILLASELIKESLGYEINNQETTTRFNLIRSRADYINFSEEKKKNCICCDNIFIDVYKDKWGTC